MTTPDEPRLDVLVCPACGAPVPIADTEAVACPHCAAEVPVPEGHREALAADRRDAAARTTANALYAELGAPPLALRIIGGMFDPSGILRPLTKSRWGIVRILAWYYTWTLFLCAPLALLLAAIVVVNLTMRGIGAAYHANVIETLPSATRDWIQVPTAFAAVLVGAALSVYGRRRSLARQKLQAALAAKPPEKLGGPSACRLCGAPLTVPDGALGVRCVYCRADNLVALPGSYVAAVGDDIAGVEREIEAAHQELASKRAELRTGLLKQVGFVTAILGLLLAYALLASGSQVVRADSVPPPWSAFARTPRPLARREPDARGLAATVTTLAFSGACPAGAKHLSLSPRDCDGHACTLRLYAAMRAGERGSITFSGVPEGTKAHVERHASWPWPKTASERFGVDVVDLDVTNGIAAEFDATWSAWHEIRIDLPVDLTATKTRLPASVGACFHAARR